MDRSGTSRKTYQIHLSSLRLSTGKATPDLAQGIENDKKSYQLYISFEGKGLVPNDVELDIYAITQFELRWAIVC